MNKQFFQGSAVICSVIFMPLKFPDPVYCIAHANSFANIMERNWDESMCVSPSVGQHAIRTSLLP